MSQLADAIEHTRRWCGIGYIRIETEAIARSTGNACDGSAVPNVFAPGRELGLGARVAPPDLVVFQDLRRQTWLHYPGQEGSGVTVASG